MTNAQSTLLVVFAQVRALENLFHALAVQFTCTAGTGCAGEFLCIVGNNQVRHATSKIKLLAQYTLIIDFSRVVVQAKKFSVHQLANPEPGWHCFDMQPSGAHPLYSTIATPMTLSSSATGGILSTGLEPRGVTVVPGLESSFEKASILATRSWTNLCTEGLSRGSTAPSNPVFGKYELQLDAVVEPEIVLSDSVELLTRGILAVTSVHLSTACTSLSTLAFLRNNLGHFIVAVLEECCTIYLPT